MKHPKVKYSIVLPCRDEERTIGKVIQKAKIVLPDAEIIVVDNNSSDLSVAIARRLGASVVTETVTGYGATLRAGFRAARGEYVIMCDSDDTYDMLELPRLIRYATNNDIVLGNRFNKNMQRKSMSFLHRYIGNPFLSNTMNILFGTGIKDTHSGMRIIKRSSLERLNLESTGMELASEMLIKAARHKMRIKEVMISYYPRVGESKLSSFNDGWKHLKMLLLYSPDYLFLVPALGLITIGIIILVAMIFGPITLGGITFDAYPTLVGSVAAILGYQLLMFWLYARTYMTTVFGNDHVGISEGKTIKWVHERFTLEKSIVIGCIFILIGLATGIAILVKWLGSGFGELSEVRQSMLALTAIVLGMQTIFSGFTLSILGIKRNL